MSMHSQVTLLRRMIALSNSHSDAAADPTALTQKILKAMGKTSTNADFLKSRAGLKIKYQIPCFFYKILKICVFNCFLKKKGF